MMTISEQNLGCKTQLWTQILENTINLSAKIKFWMNFVKFGRNFFFFKFQPTALAHVIKPLCPAEIVIKSEIDCEALCPIFQTKKKKT